MIVEHVFVTTLEFEEVKALLADFLKSLEFQIDSATDTTLEATKGRAKPTSRLITNLPQRVKVGYDRGRVTVAASIAPYRNKDLPIHSELLKALACGIETLLVNLVSVEDASSRWLQLLESRKKVTFIMDRVGAMLFGLLLFLVLLFVVGLVLAFCLS